MKGLIVCYLQGSDFRAAPKGIMKLGLSSSGRDGYVYVPAQYDPSKGSPMILAIHAAGKGSLDALQILIASANSSGAWPGSCSVLFGACSTTERYVS
jgi:hypothetical protein